MSSTQEKLEEYTLEDLVEVAIRIGRYRTCIEHGIVPAPILTDIKDSNKPLATREEVESAILALIDSAVREALEREIPKALKLRPWAKLGDVLVIGTPTRTFNCKIEMVDGKPKLKYAKREV